MANLRLELRAFMGGLFNECAPLERLSALVGDFEPGTVSLVGAGPGDSALISVRGAVRLTQADVVLHDKLIGPELLDLVRPEAEKVFVGKWRGAHVSTQRPCPPVSAGGSEWGGTHIWTQDEINEALVQHARSGLRVVRLKGGDPFVFGRGGEECEHLAAAGVRFEVVPGITAAFAAPAAAGIPLTHRDVSRSFALVTGHADPGDPRSLDFEALARMDTIAIYMGVKNLADNCRRLIEAGMDPGTPVAVIHWGSRPQQRTVVATLGDIADRLAGERIGPPAMILIGQVVRRRESIEWFERRPLHGQTIAVTRMPDQAAGLSGMLLAMGAEVIEAPTITLGELEDYTAVDTALKDIRRYDWLVITSANGVDAVFSRLEAIGADARALAGPRIAAVGTATAERLHRRSIRADLVPSEAVGEALGEALIAAGVRGKRILLLRAEVARRQIVAALQEAGAVCEDLPVYRTVCPRELPTAFVERFDQDGIHWITLTSPSSFENLLSLLGPERAERLRAVRLASIGPVTTRAIRDRGYTEAVEANPHDVSCLVSAIRQAVGQA